MKSGCHAKQVAVSVLNRTSKSACVGSIASRSILARGRSRDEGISRLYERRTEEAETYVPQKWSPKNPSIRERWQAGRTRTDLPFLISSRASRWLSMKRWERFSARGTRHSDRIRTQPSRSSMDGSIRSVRSSHECYLSPGAPDCVCEEQRRPHVIGRKVKAKEAKAKAKPYWLLPCG